MKYRQDDIVHWMAPDYYAGDSCDQVRPRWMVGIPKEGDEEEGEILKMDLVARRFPPGTRVLLEYPCCPECGESADAQTPLEPINGAWDVPEHVTEWPDCSCGFSWSNWATGQYS